MAARHWFRLICLFVLLLNAAVLATDYDLPEQVSGLGSGTSSAGPYLLTDIAGQACIGPATSTNYLVNAGFWPMIGSPPVPGALTLSALATQPAALSVAEILSAASDADGDAVELGAVAPLSTQGGTVLRDGNAVSYTSVTGFIGLDEFTYTLFDASGDFAVGIVTVLVGRAESVRPIIVYGPRMIQGAFVVRYAGVPGFTYTIEYSDGLAPPNWRKQVNITAPIEGSFGPGVFELCHLPGSAPARFFRTVYPSY
jgi:hypothetical protein